MLFFCLLNPGYKARFHQEAIRNSQTGEKWASFLRAQISKGISLVYFFCHNTFTGPSNTKKKEKGKKMEQ